MIKNLFNKISIFSKLKAFLVANPQKAKLIGIIAILAVVPLTIVAALTVQNLVQRATQSNTVSIYSANLADAPGTTTSPSVNISLNLPPGWELPPKSTTGYNFVKNAYAAVLTSEGETETIPTPSPTSIPQSSGTCTAFGGTCIPLSAACSSLGNYVYKDYNNSCTGPSPVCCVPVSASAPTPTPTAVPTGVAPATQHILQKVIVQNSGQGTIEGSSPLEITVTDASSFPTPYIIRSWSLRELSPGENSAERSVRVEFIDKNNSSVVHAASITLNNPPNAKCTGYDVNNDSKVDSADLTFIEQNYTSAETLSEKEKCADVDGNKKVDEKDYNATYRAIYSPTPPAYNSKYDMNNDQKVDKEDSDFIWNQITNVPRIEHAAKADVNGSGKVDIDDYNAVFNFVNPRASTPLVTPTISTSHKYDVNNDGTVNGTDLIIIVQSDGQKGKVGQDLPADVNDDQIVNKSDYEEVSTYLKELASLAAALTYKSEFDVNNDKVVNKQDSDIIWNEITTNVPVKDRVAKADVNGDSKVDINDYNLVFNYLNPQAPTPTPTPPPPSTYNPDLDVDGDGRNTSADVEIASRKYPGGETITVKGSGKNVTVTLDFLNAVLRAVPTP